MVSYELPKPPLGFFERARESVRLATAFFKGDRTTIADITSETVFSPLQPLQPYLPNITGRSWDYQPGYNIQFRPDGYGRVPFHELRAIARQCEILRLGLQTVKDQIAGFEWQIVPKEDSTAAPDDPRIKELTKFFQKPDRVNTWDQWLRLLLDDFLLIDATTVYRVRDRVGRPYAFEVFDGARIKVLIDADGRRPLPPDPAYQQIIKGSPRVDYTMDELLYLPRNMTPDYPVRGVSPVEEILITARTIIERQKSQLLFFTEGTLPDSYAEMPTGMTTEAIRQFEDRFNDLLRGNTAMRRGTPFLPSGSKIVPLKQTELKNDADEWFARIVCFCLGIPPTAFIKQMNRSTSESDKERSQEEGQLPKMQFVKLVMNQLIADFGDDYAENFEFSWREGLNLDPKEQADVITEYVKSGVKTINEGRADLGLDPIEGGDSPMALTPTGYVPLDSFEQNQQMQQQNMQVQADAKAAALASNAQKPDGNSDGKKPDEKPVGKAVSHEARPFHPHMLDHAEQELRIRIHAILQKTAISVIRQLSKKHLKLSKDDSDDFEAEAAVTAASLDLSSLEALVDASPEYLQRIAAESGKQTLAMIGVFNRDDLVNQVNEDSLAFAKARSAEMVGKKWVDGELVDNPNADWVITDATRDELRSIIADVYSGATSSGDLESAIKTAGAFSDERAALIARTEIINANSQGTLAGMRTARGVGVAVKKQWIPDAEACPICLENADAGAIDIDEAFPDGSDAPPSHPSCECQIVPITSDEDEE